ADVQGGSREVVDRLACPSYEISPTRRASRANITQPRYRAVSQPITAALARVKPADERPLDLLDDRSADDHKEPRNADLQDHSRDDRRGCVAPPVPHSGSFNCGGVCWEYSPPRERLAEPHRSSRDGGALQSCKQRQRCRGIRAYNFRIS